MDRKQVREAVELLLAMYDVAEEYKKERDALRLILAEGERGIERRLLGQSVALPHFFVDGSIPHALQELALRIERCASSLEQTSASSLCNDLLHAVQGDSYAMDRVEAALAAKGE